MMNILLIGNGFDLAHGLPTDYRHFLKFLRELHSPLNNQSRTNEIELPEKLRQYLKDVKGNKKPEYAAELLGLITENAWIEYFLRIPLPNRGWVGFEGEIAQIIQALDYMRMDDTPSLRRLRYMPAILETLLGLDSHAKAVLIGNIDVIIERLLQDLDKLIRCLEIYLCLCMDNYQTDKRLQQVLAIKKIDKVLSFNYTDTFRRLYAAPLGMTPEYCYIHGQAKEGDSLSLCNMVLGIDEYLDKEERDRNLDFVGFKKYYQRIFKQTDYNYTDWFSGPEEINLYIIGHSLDTTDGDVLRHILLREWGKTTIFYHSKEANAAQIANLVKVLGYDNLNALTRGQDQDRSITFSQLL